MPLQVSWRKHSAASYHPQALGILCPLGTSFFSLVSRAHVAWAAYFPGLSRGSTATTCERSGPAANNRANQGIMTSITAASRRCQGPGERACCQALGTSPQRGQRSAPPRPPAGLELPAGRLSGPWGGEARSHCRRAAPSPRPRRRGGEPRGLEEMQTAPSQSPWPLEPETKDPVTKNSSPQTVASFLQASHDLLGNE